MTAATATCNTSDVAAHVAALVRGAPPLSPAQRDRLRDLFRGGQSLGICAERVAPTTDSPRIRLHRAA
jgi:hypothetical protein